MKLSTLIELCNPLHTTPSDFDGELTSVAIDSRKVRKNGVFVAIRGTRTDGHQYLKDAIERGARVVIVEEEFHTEEEEVCIVEVENTRAIAGKLAQAFAGYPAKKMKLIGITGTNGKTTTATLVYQVLRQLEEKASLLGTVSKRILDKTITSKLTTSDPVELADDLKNMADAGSEYVVMEVSSHALDQHRVAGITFDVAAFTNLSHDHLDYHNTLEEYAQAKKRLFDQLPETSAAVVNIDDAKSSVMTKDCRAHIMPLSFKNNSSRILENSAKGLSLLVDGEQIKSKLIGTFNAYNLGQAFLICKALGLQPGKIAEALSEAKGAPGRMEIVQLDTSSPSPMVIVDYAHTPDALQNVLSTLSGVKDAEQKVTVVFGAGGDRDTTKRPEMARIAEHFADRIIVTSDNPRTENPDLIIADILNGFDKLDKVQSITDRRKAIETAIREAKNNEIILIAGKGHEDYQEIDGKRHHFDDREIAREFLTQKSGVH